jgi:hypothetical protein
MLLVQGTPIFVAEVGAKLPACRSGLVHLHTGRNSPYFLDFLLSRGGPSFFPPSNTSHQHPRNPARRKVDDGARSP